jgi:hypothetical protein
MKRYQGSIQETVQVLTPLQGVARQLFTAVPEPNYARGAACAAGRCSSLWQTRFNCSAAWLEGIVSLSMRSALFCSAFWGPAFAPWALLLYGLIQPVRSSRSFETWTHLGPSPALSRQHLTISRTASLVSITVTTICMMSATVSVTLSPVPYERPYQAVSCRGLLTPLKSSNNLRIVSNA